MVRFLMLIRLQLMVLLGWLLVLLVMFLRLLVRVMH
jgi:hypothetical protein